jgi:rhodanese-related sulfurtransferase
MPTNSSEVPRISPEELQARLDQGEAILIVDTRPVSLFNIRHIAGAVSIAEGEIPSRFDELLRDQEIVFYCT